MKTKNLLKTILLFIFLVSFVGCEKNEENGTPKVAGYQEYILTIALQKLQGIVDTGFNILSDVDAAKKNISQQWKQLAGTQGLDYENSYEYATKISEINYLDFSCDTPAWSEYKLLEIISKEKKNYQGLPENFIPNWWYPNEEP